MELEDTIDLGSIGRKCRVGSKPTAPTKSKEMKSPSIYLVIVGWRNWQAQGT